MSKKSKKTKQKKVDPSYLEGSRVKMSLRKHVLPPLTGLAVMFAVLALFNSQIIASQVYALTYKAPVSTNVPVESAPVDPNAPPTLTIGDIGVHAPVIYGEKSISETNFQKALQSGVVHYPNTATPGQPGNAVIFGHSSGQVWAPGNYKFVFTHLDKLSLGKRIFLEYKGVRYIYRVTNMKVVAPTDVSVLAQDPSKHTLTLITCTPVGTNKNRLIVTAEQVVPVPTSASAAENKQPITELEQLPGTKNPSLWESIRNQF